MKKIRYNEKEFEEALDELCVKFPDLSRDLLREMLNDVYNIFERKIRLRMVRQMKRAS